MVRFSCLSLLHSQYFFIPSHLLTSGETRDSDDEEDDDFIGPAVSEAAPAQRPAEPEMLKRDETLRLNAPVREWDKGKKGETELHLPSCDLSCPSAVS